MIEWEQKMELHILYKQGKSLREISQQSGLSVNTIRKYLSLQGKPCYKKRSKVKQKLDPYKSYLRHRCKAAHPIKLPGSVLLREIQYQGYKGGVTQLREFLCTLKEKREPEALIRFETKPGQQLQVDWIEFPRVLDIRAAFVATLGYSRASYVQFVSNEQTQTLIECHERAFEYFGGVPHHVLYDNMKTVILARDTYGPGRHRFQAGLLDFAHHYGFELKVCRPYRAQTKGKVERFNRYLRHSFYNPLVTQLKMQGLSLDLTTANGYVMTWLRDVANVRCHQTTHQRPCDLLIEERAFLQPLPAPYTGQIKSVSALPSTGSSPYPVSLQHPLWVYDQLLEE